MKKLLLRNKKNKEIYALIDDEDFDLVKDYKWHLQMDKYVSAYIYLKKENGKKINKVIYLHRLIMNPKKNQYVDHKDRNPLNNQKINLRLCSNIQNSYNSKPKRDRIYKGVCWDKNRSKWLVRIQAEGKNHHIGRYISLEEALEKYNLASRKLHGEYAFLNIYGK